MTPHEGPADGIRHVFIRDLVMPASIGVYAHEHRAPQRVRINVCLSVEDETAQAGGTVGPDDVARVVDYEKIVVRVRQVVNAGHVRLCETLAERIAEVCLTDPRVRDVRARVEKLDVFPDVEAVGVEIRRNQPPGRSSVP